MTWWDLLDIHALYLAIGANIYTWFLTQWDLLVPTYMYTRPWCLWLIKDLVGFGADIHVYPAMVPLAHQRLGGAQNCLLLMHLKDPWKSFKKIKGTVTQLQVSVCHRYGHIYVTKAKPGQIYIEAN